MIDLAIRVAALAHKSQRRKGTDMPYIVHPFAVGMILQREGCEEELVAAGILHDTVEDTDVTLEKLRGLFGERIAAIVEGCSEPDKSLPWEARKRHMIEYLKAAPPDIRIVSCADKLHNVQSISRDFAEAGEAVWDRFKEGRARQAWCHRGLVESFCGRRDAWPAPRLFDRYRRAVESLFG